MTKISVLYVDDEPPLLEVARLFLERSGSLSVTTVDSAKKALEILKVRSFDAIISDYQMPEMNGIEFLKIIRADFDSIPFILFTGKGREEVVVDALNSGADSYLQKGGNPVAQFVELEHKIKINVERRQDHLALCESEKKYRQLVENAQESISIIQDGKFAFYNPKFGEIVSASGFTCQDFFSRPFFTFAHPEDQAILRERYQKRITLGERFPRYPFRVIDNMGFIRWWEVDAIRITWNGRPATLNFSRDITEEYRLRDQLIESEARYRELVESLPKTVIELDDQLKVTFMNRAGREKWGYTDPTNTTPLSVLELIPPDLRTHVNDRYLQALKGDVPPAHEMTALRRDGSTFPMVVYMTPIRRNNSVEGFRLVCVDVSEEKKLQDELVQANKKLNLMCRITWHDLNNKLFSLMAYLDIAKDHATDEQVLFYLQKTIHVANTIQEQIQFTKTYQEIGLSEPEWQRVKEVIEKIRMALPLENIDLMIDVRNVEIYADLLLEKVFYNLFENSLHHGEHVSAISISCRRNEHDLILTYEDNGVGISPEDRSHLFTCGFGKHTGLGLFLIQKILGITGMSIEETGESGKGVQFEIVIPQDKFRFAKEESGEVQRKVTS